MSGNTIDLLTGFYTPGTTPLDEYPRSHFIRDSYLNLNGHWDYAISPLLEVNEYDGKILVPFSPECVLSGVKRQVDQNHYLFYHRLVKLPSSFRKEHLILHFGAVDQEVDIFIDDYLVASEQSPYLPFSVDLTNYVSSDSFDIKLRVKDATRLSNHLVGKQHEKRGGIWYTPQSGVWQTVWLESLPSKYLKNVEIEPLFDQKEIHLHLDKVGEGVVEIKVSFQGEVLYQATTNAPDHTIKLDEIKPWSPDHPQLYDIEYTFAEDSIKSYFAFRKIEAKRDQHGFQRFYLNNKPIFQSGVLDQGYYSDGLLTPPSDEAMVQDIMLLKKMGFNMLRKHIKVEPLRFYYHCDRLGMLVWQDMINLVPPSIYNLNGALAMFLEHHPSDRIRGRFGVKNELQKRHYRQGLKQMIQLLKPFPSIVTWVPFNEGWGQFNSKEAVEIIKGIDKTRLIDHASGWSDQKVGDYYSRHIYFKKLHIVPTWVKNRIIAISEFGGYSHSIDQHVFNPTKEFGYKRFDTLEGLHAAVSSLYLDQVKPLIAKGLSALVYTQLSDVEDEVNGLITYDRKVVKFDINQIKSINNELFQTFSHITES